MTDRTSSIKRNGRWLSHQPQVCDCEGEHVYRTSRIHFNHYLRRTLDPSNRCSTCGDIEAFCFCGGFLSLPILEPARQDPSPAAFSPGQQRNRNEASPLPRQEMECSSGSGASAAPAPPLLSPHPHSTHETGGMTMQGASAETEGDFLESMGPQDAALLGSTAQHMDSLQTSDWQGNARDHDAPGPDDEAARLLNGLAFGEQNALMQQLMPNIPLFDNSEDHSNMLMDSMRQTYGPSASIDHEDEVDPEKAKAYAKLAFSDGDLFITTHDVVLGRNMERFEQIKRRKKQEQRAREELDTYRKEPSQPSQHGDQDQQGDPSNSSQSLEGRPAPPSNFSEQGGPVWYPPQDDQGGIEMQRTRPRRRVSHFSKSSSTTSVAPANLHAGMMPDIPDSYNEPVKRTCAFIPIHTEIPEHITKISKEHLMFSFNFQDEQWELKVVGNRAFVNEELFEKGTTIPLQHNDEIIIASVSMVFKLPDNFRHSPGLSRGTFSKHSDDEALSEESDEADRLPSTSPARRLSNAVETEDSESEDEEVIPAQTGGRRSAPRLKLKTKISKKKPQAAKSTPKEKLQKPKKQAKRESSSEASPAPADKKHDKEKKPKAASKADADANREPGSSPPAAPFIKPGSVLEGIPVEELPEKRKGPGRPPKEGNVSKRDTQLANKKKKEYEKRGEEPPPFKELVNIVRRESKLKEWQAKMEANGQLEPGQQIRPSIEIDGDGQTTATFGKDGTEAGPSNHESAKRSSPKPKRQIRTISPVKPESECTAEELKKPDHTYVHIIDQVLSEHHTGIADLQEIYELIMKKYPYYKYKQSTMGWQSSVRHNLLQSPRFKDVGKSGKGKLWTIDHDSPLEKEKRKRTSPPPKGPMANGQYPMGQPPHAQYGNPYGGQQRPNGPHPASTQVGTYYSPYAQPGYAPQANGTQQPLGYTANQSVTYQQHPPNGGNASPQPTPWDNLVKEILQFNHRHSALFVTNPAEQQRQLDILTAITEFLSECYSSKVPDAGKAEKVKASDAKVAFGGLAEIFRRHKPDIRIPDPWSGVSLEEQLRSSAPPGPADAAAAAAPTGMAVQSMDPSMPSGLQLSVAEDVAGEASTAPADTALQIASAPMPTRSPVAKRAADDDGDEPEAKRTKSD